MTLQLQQLGLLLLQQACIQGHASVAEELLKRGIGVKAKDVSMFPAACYFIDGGLTFLPLRYLHQSLLHLFITTT